jgi:Protein of unknown function (DUF1638)
MKKFKLISCEVVFREMCAVVARSPHQIDVEFCPKGLHDLGGRAMRARLQEVVDGVDFLRYDAVLMGYALCGNGLLGLEARNLPLVVPRAHDCITLLIGSRHRYQEYFEKHSGVYFRSTGWIERGGSIQQLSNPALSKQVGASLNLEDLIDQYGEDNGRYLYEQFTQYKRNYHQLTFIETGLEPDDHFEKLAREEAIRNGWCFEKLRGELGLFEKLVSGEWPEKDFLIVPRGYHVKATYTEDVIEAEKSS